MNRDTRDFICLIFLIVFIVCFFGVGMSYMSFTSARTKCERLDSYGYETEMSSFGDYFTTEPQGCFIVMQDGTRVASYDFNIADFKQPRLKQTEE